MNIDRTPPTAALSGSLYDSRGTSLANDDPYVLNVTPTDPPPTGSTGPASGIRSVQVAVNAVAVSCGTNCAATVSWSFDPDIWDAGSYTLVVSTQDNAGNTSTQQFTFQNPTGTLSDDSLANDPVPDDSDLPTVDPSACDAAFGAGTTYCEDPDVVTNAEGLPTGLRIGMADGSGDSTSSWLDLPSFTALSIHFVRRVVPYNTTEDDSDRAKFDYFYRRAMQLHLEITVAFTAADGAADVSPHSNTYSTDIALFKNRYPKVRYFAGWNEPNDRRAPTSGQQIPGETQAHTGASQAARYT